MLIFGGMGTITGAVLGTFLISLGLEMVRWLETGPNILGVDLPEVLGLSGIALGAVIVFTMALRPRGIMGETEIEDLVLKTRGDRVCHATTRSTNINIILAGTIL